MTREEPWMELDEELARYFRALAAEEVPERDPHRVQEARRHYRAMVRALRPPRQTLWETWLARMQQPALRWAFAFVLLLAFLFTGGVAVVRAAEGALPGSPLYTVKRWQENLLLMRARDPRVRAQLHQRFAQRRIHELRDLLARGQQQDSLALLENLLYHVDALAQMAQGEPGLSQTDLVADMQMLAPVVDPQHRQALLQTINALYEGERLVGVLVQRQGTEWTIDGTQVVLTPDTLVQGVPRAGDVVEVVGRPMDDGRWQAQWIRVAARAEGQAPLEISIVGEVQRQGQTWRIDRHAFVLADPALAEALTPGALVEVHLRWDPQAEVWKAVKVEPKTSYRGQVREIYGYLEALEPHRVRVNGIWWTLAPEAEIEGPLQVGAYVELELWQDAQGQWLVLEVEVEEEEEERYESGEHENEMEHEEEHEGKHEEGPAQEERSLSATLGDAETEGVSEDTQEAGSSSEKASGDEGSEEKNDEESSKEEE